MWPAQSQHFIANLAFELTQSKEIIVFFMESSESTEIVWQSIFFWFTSTSEMLSIYSTDLNIKSLVSVILQYCSSQIVRPTNIS